MKNRPEKKEKTEVWLRGPIKGVPPVLQPAAHALLQAREDVYQYTENMSESELWSKPFGRASVGFHLQHLTGVLDRMLTYAKGQTLSEAQFEYLKKEGMPNAALSTDILVSAFDEKVTAAMDYFKTVQDTTLTESRTVGRKKLPSTVIGLLFHAAEHSQRHIGQLLVTKSILENPRQIQ